MVKINRLISKEEKQYIFNNLNKFQRINKKEVIQQLNQGVMNKKEFADFIRLIEFLAFNQEPKNDMDYNTLELIDIKLEKIHRRLEIKYNKFFGESII